MSNFELVLTDFDGTVVEFGKHVVSDKVRQAVIACEDKGVRTVPVTGRYYEMALPVLEVLGFDGLGVFDNGASIVDVKTGEVVWSRWIDPELVKKVATILAPAAKIIDYDPEHNEHVPADNEVDLINLVDRPTSHVYGLIRPDQVETVSERLAEVEGITFYTAPSTKSDVEGTGFQVNHIQADKFHGVEALRQIVGVPKEHTLAIGDGDNDVALFRNAGLKIAMGNATEMLKAEADHVVGPVSEDGFVEAMERFVLS